MKRIAGFILVGGVGFVVDAAVLALLLAVTPLGPFSARLLSIAFALGMTWQLNRHVTFQPSSRGLAREGARYGSVGVATSVINYIVYSLLLAALPSMPPLAALTIASLIAMAFSFFGYSRLVFNR